MMTTDAPSPPPLPVVQDDRLCERCGFNLYGQRIEREPEYGLHIVTCPHCGRVAAVDSYPRLGPWAARWAMLGAAAWLLLLLAIGIGGLVFVTSTTIMATIEVTELRERFVRESFQAWSGRVHPDDPARNAMSAERFREFWASEGEMVLNDPAWTDRPVEYGELVLVLLPSIGAFALGVVWSLVTLAARRLPLVLIAAAVAVLYVAGAGVGALALASTPLSGPEHVSWLHQRIWWVMALLPAMAGVFVAGLMAGRPIARGIVRALMPPRFRGALSLLWRSEGRRVPWRPERPVPRSAERPVPGRR